MLLKRLLYRSLHRGSKETDAFLGAFATQHLAEFSEEELLEYQCFLEESDIDIFYWITGKMPFPSTYSTRLIERLTAFKCHVSQNTP